MSLPRETIENVWKSWETILSVLKDRGYSSEVKDRHLTCEEFKAWAGESTEEEIFYAMSMKVGEDEDSDEVSSVMPPILVVWSAVANLGVNIRDIKVRMDDEGCERSIVIVKKKITTQAAATRGDLRRQGIYIDTYTFQETLYNVMRHRLVPKFELCSPKEQKALMKSYSLDRSQLPHIKLSDPVCRHFGVRKGDLFRIKRSSETQKGRISLTYRLVV